MAPLPGRQKIINFKLIVSCSLDFILFNKKKHKNINFIKFSVINFVSQFVFNSKQNNPPLFYSVFSSVFLIRPNHKPISLSPHSVASTHPSPIPSNRLWFSSLLLLPTQTPVSFLPQLRSRLRHPHSILPSHLRYSAGFNTIPLSPFFFPELQTQNQAYLFCVLFKFRVVLSES